MTTEMLDTPTTETAAIGRMIPIRDLFPSPLNPRKRFDESTLADLAANIQKHGVIVPLLVRPTDGFERYEVIDGERRYRAAKAHTLLLELPAIVRNDLTDGEVIEIQLLSAIQRQDLTPLEEAQGYQALIESNPSRYSAAYIADRIGRSERYVWDRMQLLQLIEPARELLADERILVGHAELLAKLKPEDQARAIGWDRLEGFDPGYSDTIYLTGDSSGMLSPSPFHLRPATSQERGDTTLGERCARWPFEIRFDVQTGLQAGPCCYLGSLSTPLTGSRVVTTSLTNINNSSQTASRFQTGCQR